uniref:Uncharacterized protein n=1 Tax=Anguilla anguilla TaxID=7936 RepID=A0A0E9WUX8_ANGAN
MGCLMCANSGRRTPEFTTLKQQRELANQNTQRYLKAVCNHYECSQITKVQKPFRGIETQTRYITNSSCAFFFVYIAFFPPPFCFCINFSTVQKSDHTFVYSVSTAKQPFFFSVKTIMQEH